MPKVPTLDAPRVSSTGLSGGAGRVNVNASASAFGADGSGVQLGQAINQLGSSISGFVASEVEKANKAKLYDAENEYLNGQQEIENWFREQKGQNALGLDAEYEKKLKALSDQSQKSLWNGAQRQGFSRIKDSRDRQLQKHYDSHVAAQADQVQLRAYQTNIKLNQENAIRNFNDPTAIRQAKNSQAQAIMDFSQAKGLSKEEADLAVLDAFSKTNYGILQKYVDNDADRMAVDFFEKHKHEMSADDVSRAEKLIEQATLNGESQRIADQILSKNLGNRESLEMVRDIEDPKLREETNRKVKMQLAENEQARNADLNKRFNSVYNQIDATGTMPPVSVMAQFDAADQERLKGYFMRKRSGQDVKTDFGAYTDLRTMASSPELRDDFLKANISREYAGKLSNSDMKKMIDLQAGLRSGKGGDTVSNFRSNVAIEKQYIQEMDLNPKNDDDAKKIRQFSSRLEEEANSWMRENGKKKVPNEITRQIADRLIMEVEVEGSGIPIPFTQSRIFTSKQKVFEIEGAPVPVAGGIKENDMKMIVDYLKKNNHEINERNIGIVKKHLGKLKSGG